MPTELRVAQLAQQGISNSGIAEQTFAVESRDQLLRVIND
jgi:hypothetical protein